MSDELKYQIERTSYPNRPTSILKYEVPLFFPTVSFAVKKWEKNVKYKTVTNGRVDIGFWEQIHLNSHVLTESGHVDSCKKKRVKLILLFLDEIIETLGRLHIICKPSLNSIIELKYIQYA